MNLFILIVDDEPQDAWAITRTLQKAGYEQIACVDSPRETLEILKDKHPDLILIDVVLKGDDGFDLCKELREKNHYQGLIIMITGHLDAIIADKARLSGADEIIEKIPEFTNIQPAITRLLSQKEN